MPVHANVNTWWIHLNILNSDDPFASICKQLDNIIYYPADWDQVDQQRVCAAHKHTHTHWRLRGHWGYIACNWYPKRSQPKATVFDETLPDFYSTCPVLFCVELCIWLPHVFWSCVHMLGVANIPMDCNVMLCNQVATVPALVFGGLLPMTLEGRDEALRKKLPWHAMTRLLKTWPINRWHLPPGSSLFCAS